MGITRRIFLSSLVGIFALTGCTNGGTTANGGGGTNGKKLKIGVSLPTADHGWTGGAVWWANEAKKLHPDIEFNIQTAKDPSEQINQIETLMTQGVDALVVLATESAPLTPVAKQVREKGILLVNVDRGFTEPVADVFIEGDNKAFGRKSAEYICQKLGAAGGNILILQGLPSTVNTDRVNGAQAVFDKHPEVKILDSQAGKWSKEESLKVMQTLLVKYPKVDAIWSSDDDMSLGAEQALKEAGRDKNIWMLGGGGMKEIVKRIMDKDAMYPATVTYPPSMTAVAVQTAVSILQNGNRKNVQKFMPKHFTIDVDIVTPENAKDYYFPDSVY